MSYFDILVYICVIAAVSGVSPTLISVFTSMLGGALGKGHTSSKIWLNSLAFFTGFVATITLLGFAFWSFLSRLCTEVCGQYAAQTSQYVCIGVALLAIAAAIIEIKDYFWYGQGVSHKPHKRLRSSIHKRTSKKIGFVNAFLLGIIAVAATASNIGLVTITVACLLSVSGTVVSASWFVLFGLCLLVGALFTLIAVAGGIKVSAVMQWKEESKAVMRLGSGLALLATAWLILLIISGTISVSQTL